MEVFCPLIVVLVSAMPAVWENMSVPFGASTASPFPANNAQYHLKLLDIGQHWGHAHHNLLETNVKQETKQETLNCAPKTAAVPLAATATIVVVSVISVSIHSLVALYG